MEQMLLVLLLHFAAAQGSDFWTVQSGTCAINADSCASSPGYPQNYTKQDACIIAVNASAWSSRTLLVFKFDTELNLDNLTVNSLAFSGSGANLNLVRPNGTIYWAAAAAGQPRQGWLICPSPLPTGYGVSKYVPSMLANHKVTLVASVAASCACFFCIIFSILFYFRHQCLTKCPCFRDRYGKRIAHA